jgi:hypothetical protein
MQIVVAGSTGLVSSALNEAFASAGHEVIGLNRAVVNLVGEQAQLLLKDLANHQGMRGPWSSRACGTGGSLEHHEFHPEPGLQGLGGFLPLDESIGQGGRA